ncbi:MAG: hddC 1 [Gammaproteobacteria bacterium]|jgi:MurNAc alpha-1-phosphate uridylyltransferase|nr:hddC 1 [Gammaproteobacteria bacterium]
MRGMILAAGRGDRMGALTNVTPKPLLRAGKHYLIEYSIAALIKAGIREIVINISYGREQIKAALGNGERYGVIIYYSEEEERLETGGGILQALPLLGQAPFIVISSDIISSYDLQKLPKEPQALAHLVLVKNPPFHPQGDFSLEGRRIYSSSSPTFTFANIGVYRPELFVGCKLGRFPLGPLLHQAIARQQITGEYFAGQWHNIGTPEQLYEFNECYSEKL